MAMQLCSMGERACHGTCNALKCAKYMMKKNTSLTILRALWTAFPAVILFSMAHGNMAHAAGTWSASDCGKEPTPPTVDISSVEHYNTSVDKVMAYEKAARTYNACVASEATKAETAVSNDAKQQIDHIHAASVAVQKKLAANFVDLSGKLKAGSKKFSAQ